MSRLRLLALLALLPAACGGGEDVVLYCALDQVHAEELVRRFEARTGLTVRAEYDTEANKTVGLVARLRAERERPRCDVFWNNEIAHTVALADEGLLAPYASPNAAGIPPRYRGAGDLWTGFAARARILIANTELVDPAELHGTWDLVDPRWAGRAAMARPLTGTTLTHAVALYEVLGEARARAYLTAVRRANAAGALHLASGNGQVMRLVRSGEAAFGWTDTDDFNVARQDGFPVACVWPDQEPGPDGGEPLGVLVIPNTVCIVRGAPHAANARRLVDYLLSEEVESDLADSSSAQIPVRSSVPRPAGMVDLEELRVMDVDFAAVGRALSARQAELKELFLD